MENDRGAFVVNPEGEMTGPFRSVADYIAERRSSGVMAATYCTACGDTRTVAEVTTGPIKYDPTRNTWPVRCRVCGADLNPLPPIPEVTVAPAIAAAANPKRRFFGRSYEVAAKFVAFKAPCTYDPAEAPEWAHIRLVHGHSSIGKGLPRLDHAWVEIGGVVFEPTCQRFYDRAAYEDFYDAVKLAEYTTKEVLDNMIDIGHFGPWN